MSVQGSDGYIIPINGPWIDDPEGEEGPMPSIRGHAWMTYQALKKLNLHRDEEKNKKLAHKGRSGNWQRDLSQAILPMFNSNSLEGTKIIFSLLDILHLMEFGLRLNPNEFGSYDPVEHLDNPAGEYGTNVFKQVKDFTFEDIDSMQNKLLAGDENYSFAMVDTRYKETYESLLRSGLFDETEPLNRYSSFPFKIDKNGIVCFMHTSKEWLGRKTKEAIINGRQNPYAARCFASAVHVLQDYFFHSNFIEIAINLKLKEYYRANPTFADKKYLDTYIYTFDSDLKSEDNKRNLKINERYVLSTGTFSKTDTVQSLKKEVTANFLKLNPFESRKGEPNRLAIAFLDFIELVSEDEIKRIGAKAISLYKEKFDGFIQPFINDAISDAESEIEELRLQSLETVEKIGLVGYSINNFKNESCNVVARFNPYLGELCHQNIDLDDLLEELKNRLTELINKSTELSDKVAAILSEELRIAILMKELLNYYTDKNSKVLREIYMLFTPRPLIALRALMERLGIPTAFVDFIEDKQEYLREEISKLLYPRYIEVTNYIIEEWIPRFEDFIKNDEESTLFHRSFKLIGRTHEIQDSSEPDIHNIDKSHTFIQTPNYNSKPIITPPSFIPKYKPHKTEKNAYLAYWPPSHSMVGKDHPPIITGASIDDKNGHDSADTSKKHTHHADWLHPIAEAFAMTATYQLGEVVKKYWDSANLSDLDESIETDIKKVLDDWMVHPENNMPIWEDFIPPINLVIGGVFSDNTALEERSLSYPDYLNSITSPLSPLVQNSSIIIGIQEALRVIQEPLRIKELRNFYEGSLQYRDYLKYFSSELHVDKKLKMDG